MVISLQDKSVWLNMANGKKLLLNMEDVVLLSDVVAVWNFKSRNFREIDTYRKATNRLYKVLEESGYIEPRPYKFDFVFDENGALEEIRSNYPLNRVQLPDDLITANWITLASLPTIKNLSINQ